MEKRKRKKKQVQTKKSEGVVGLSGEEVDVKLPVPPFEGSSAASSSGVTEITTEITTETGAGDMQQQPSSVEKTKKKNKSRLRKESLNETQKNKKGLGAMSTTEVKKSKSELEKGSIKQKQDSIDVKGAQEQLKHPTEATGVKIKPTKTLAEIIQVKDTIKKAEVKQIHEPLQTLVEQLPHSGGIKPPLRIDFGKRGRPISLRANHFLVQFDAKSKLHHYDVDIKPELKGNKSLKREIFDKVTKSFPRVFGSFKCVFDGEKNMYANQEIKGITKEGNFEVNLSSDKERERIFVVAMKKVAEIRLQEVQNFLRGDIRDAPQHAIQALDIVFRHLASLKHISIGRSLYPFQNDKFDLGGGVEMWRGYYQSIRPGKWKDCLQLNLDVSNRSFYTAQPAIEFAKTFLRCRSVEDLSHVPIRSWSSFANEIKGVRIEVIHNPPTRRKYKIIGLGPPPAEHQFLVEKDGGSKMYTTEKYFADTYKYKLKYPYMPSLQAQPKEKKTFLPIEICVVLAGQKSKKLAELQTANMIRKTAISAPNRQKEVMNLLKATNLNQDPCVKEFGMSVTNEMMRFAGRVLPPPYILLNKEIQPRDGVWDVQGLQLYDGADIRKWALMIHPDCRIRPENINQFWRDLVKVGHKIGISIADPSMVRNIPKRYDLEEEFRKDFQLFIIILPRFNSPFYGEVKRKCDIALGKTTQCILSNTLETKCNSPTLINLLLKINAKLGKLSSILSTNKQHPRSFVFLKPVIILGADVTHPAPGENKRPSIAAIVGSMDAHAQKYVAKICIQNHRKEVIQNLKEKVRELLIEFYRATRLKPERIIFYRDGVGEGQFYEVLCNELMAIRAACSSLEQGYQPRITFLVVQKRHHTRLFCENPNADGIGRSQNVPPGTVVDTTIVHPTENDFFLCSHQGIQGTSRPAHYHVLWDDSDIHADDLQQLTYELCHTYVRCSRAVSIPAPAYYAHLAAFKARTHLEPLQRKLDQTGIELDRMISEMEKAVQTHIEASKMYFV